jgi:hypothetical protein
MTGFHVVSAALWAVTWPGGFLPALRRWRWWFPLHHLSFLLLLVSGAAIMHAHGWGLGHAGWLAVKMGLAAFLFLPIEGFHAYICHVFLPRARTIAGPMGERQVERGVGLEAIIRTISIPLYLVAIPLAFWLGVARPF